MPHARSAATRACFDRRTDAASPAIRTKVQDSQSRVTRVHNCKHGPDDRRTIGRLVSGSRPAGQPTRIADVARAAGVSAQTVSNVLNGRPGYTEATRDRVLAAVHRLGFVPNRAARHLRTKRSRQIGVHLRDDQLSVRNPFTLHFLHAVLDAARRVDHQIVVFTNPIDEASVENGLLTFGVDGFVLSNTGPTDPRAGVLAAAGVPFAVVGRTAPSVPQAWVDIDNAAAMATVVDHLVGRGHESFGYVGYPLREYWDYDRLRGVRDALRRHGRELPDERIVLDDIDELGDLVTQRLLTGGRPDAVICSSDVIATLVYQRAHRAGLVPGVDVAVTGFDALPLVELEPRLTSVALPVTAFASAVIRFVTDQIEGAPAGEQGELVPAELVVGGST